MKITMFKLASMNRLVATGLCAFLLLGSSLVPANAAPISDAAEIPAAEHEAAEQCDQQVTSMLRTDASKTKKLSAGTINYSCLNGAVTLVAELDASKIVTNVKGDVNALALADGDYWVPENQPARQEIWDNYRGNVVSTVYYGQMTTSGTVLWKRGVNFQLTARLQTNRHTLQSTWVSSNLQYLTVNYYTQLLDMQGITVPKIMDHVFISNSPGASLGEDYNTSLEQTKHNNVMSASLADIQITDQSKAFTIRVKGSIAVPRFLCTPAEQCRYPDGKEAPIF